VEPPARNAPDTSPVSTAPRDEAALDALLSEPTAPALRALERLDGDFILLGAGGKMGPTLARMLRRGMDACGRSRQRVYAVARFSDPRVGEALQEAGIDTVRCDLTDRGQVADLPDAPNVLYLAGQKFGTVDAPELTWALNTHVPALAAERYADSRIVAFSTGCVYSPASLASGGSREEDPLEPLGEYANSCVGRERIFSYFSRRHGTPGVLFRLNYAIDLRYGVLVDIARKVRAGEPIDLTTGFVNVIWQGDACAAAIACLEHAVSPPLALNVTGPETLSVRRLAEQFGELLGREPRFVGAEAPTALLANAARAHALFGYPSVTVNQLVVWTAAWLSGGGRVLNRPTPYEVRDGKY
jgi:nucleoside-diphosphate-sugar epimerase